MLIPQVHDLETLKNSRAVTLDIVLKFLKIQITISFHTMKCSGTTSQYKFNIRNSQKA